MPYLLGTDEAGYGPNFGPLIISATLWQVPRTRAARELYDVLADCVSRTVQNRGTAAECRKPRLAIADSKQLYSPSLGLRSLEHSVLAALSAMDESLACWRDIWHALAGDAMDDLDAEPWNDGYDVPLPVSAAAEEVAAAAACFRAGLKAAGVRLVAVRSQAVFPARFNALCDEFGTKGSVLSRLTLQLAAGLLPLTEGEPVQVVCDKHGGRNQYAALLMETMTEDLVKVVCESRAESAYRWGKGAQRRDVFFRAGGEAFLPSALASMVSKYLRELAMLPFNDFWRQHVPGISPTAGYPGDSKRFKREIAVAQAKLGIADGLLWRAR